MRQLNGMILVISRNPRKLEVIAGRNTQRIFTRGHREQLLAIMKKNLRTAPDMALANATAYIRDTLMAVDRTAALNPVPQLNSVATGTSNEHAGFSWLRFLVIAIIVLLIFRLITYLIASRSSAGQISGAANSSVGNGFGGGGFLSSLFGGVFGAVAGNWLYDKLFSPDHREPRYYGNDSYRSSPEEWRNDDHGDFDASAGSEGDWEGDDADAGGDW